MSNETHQGIEGNYTAKWLSIRSDLLRPVVLPKLYKTYGRAFDYLDFLSMTGKNGLVPGRQVDLWEQGNLKANCTTSTAITTGSLGADISFKISTTLDYDSLYNHVLRDGVTVYIPQKYQPTTVNIPMAYQVVSHSGSTNDVTFVARPFASGAAQIAVEVPIGTKLSLGPIQYAPGMGLPTGLTESYLKRSFYSTIIKEKLAIEGGFLSQQYWEPFESDGKLMGYTNKLLMDVEFRLDDALNQYIGFGQANDNAALVQTSNFGGSNKVLSGNGIWPSLDASAQQLWYSGAFEHTDYKTVKDLLESQGVVDSEVIFAMGSELFDDAEQADLDFIKEYSGGSDLIRNGMSIGIPISQVKRSGLTFNKLKLKSLSNPFSMGNTEYEMGTAGFIMPTTKAKVTQKSDGSNPVYLNNVELRFLGKGSENRTRVLGELNGISGMPGTPVNGNDGKEWGMLTEPILLLTNLNQCVQVRKE
jgi:hypothetical protein